METAYSRHLNAFGIGNIKGEFRIPVFIDPGARPQIHIPDSGYFAPFSVYDGHLVERIEKQHMTNSPEKRRPSNGIVYFVGQPTTNYGPAFAAGLISIVPLLLIFVFGQKYFVNSIVSSGTKE